MRQPSPISTERRLDPRHPAAFAFWIRYPHQDRRISAWMLDMSTGGAAFLTAAVDAPPVGMRLRLTEMTTTDRLVRDDAQPLPAFARVVRHDDCEGVTRRVAVRFEADVDADADTTEQQEVTAVCSRPSSLPSAPLIGDMTHRGQLIGWPKRPPT